MVQEHALGYIGLIVGDHQISFLPKCHCTEPAMRTYRKTVNENGNEKK